VEFLLDPRFMQADVFMAFNRTLKMGIQDLYMDTKDISNLRVELQNKSNNSDKAKQQLFAFEADKKREQAENRIKLE
jgi:hypothetical protein